MKSNILLILLLLLVGSTSAQDYSRPDGIVRNPANGHYFITNKKVNTVVELGTDGTVTNFITTNLDQPKGLWITGDTLICVNNTTVQGYKLADASLIFNVSVTGSKFMNDVVTDGKGNLYISDSQTSSIYKFVLKDLSYTTQTKVTGLPNGLVYLDATNELIINYWEENARIESYNITTDVVKTLMTTTFTNLDGMTTDNCGNFYMTAWKENAIYRFDPTFTHAPVEVSSGHNGPADLTFDPVKQTLTAPNFYGDNISTVTLGVTCATAPANEATNTSTSPTLDWEDVPTATTYTVEYSTDANFATVKTTTASSSEANLADLEENTHYFWRVKASGGGVSEAYSPAWSFTTQMSTGLIQPELENKYDVYPNPVINSLRIRSNRTAPKVQHYSIVDLNGKTVQLGQYSGQEIEVANVNSGWYVLLLATTEGSTSKKIRVQ